MNMKIRSILQKEVNSFKHSPGTHCSGAACLVSKLEVIETEVNTEENNEDPVYEFQQDATYGNTAVVFADADASEFVLNDGNQGCQQQNICDMSMNQETLENKRKLFIKGGCCILEAV